MQAPFPVALGSLRRSTCTATTDHPAFAFFAAPFAAGAFLAAAFFLGAAFFLPFAGAFAARHPTGSAGIC